MKAFTLVLCCLLAVSMTVGQYSPLSYGAPPMPPAYAPAPMPPAYPAAPRPSYGYAPSPMPSHGYAPRPYAPTVYTAAAPTMSTYTIHTYHSPAPRPVVNAPPSYVPVRPAYSPSAYPSPSYGR